MMAKNKGVFDANAGKKSHIYPKKCRKMTSKAVNWGISPV